MLYLTVFVSCILLSALPSSLRKGSEVVVSRGKSSTFWGRAVDTQAGRFRVQSITLSVSHYLLYLQMCQYRLFPNRVFLCTIVCHESE